jgi:hypothetical protein
MKTNTPRRSHLHRALSNTQCPLRTACAARLGPLFLLLLLTLPAVVEASATLASDDWVPLQTLNLTNGAFYFSDPNWTNYPARNYRIRSP